MSAAIRHEDLRKRNRALVLSAVRRVGQPSRTELALATGLSNSTVSTISADLIGEGILVEVRSGGSAASKRGRPQVALGLNPPAATVVAVVLSLNSLSAAAIDYSGGRVCEQHLKLETQQVGRQELVEQTLGVVRRLIAMPEMSSRRVVRIVLAIQGITDADERRLLWSPITPHTEIPFADIVENAFAIPANVENDCNMMAVALRARRPQRSGQDFIAILLSHGIGMGLVRGGALFTGTRSSGGEFGHMVHQPGGALCRCGRHGCIEAYAGNYAIWRNATGTDERSRPGGDVAEAEMRDLARRARLREGAEREAYRRAGTAVGFGLGNLFALIDPAPVAFVGGGTAAFDLLEPHIRSALAATAGGLHLETIDFQTEEDELPVIREGCAIRALDYVDREIFAAGRAPLTPYDGAPYQRRSAAAP